MRATIDFADMVLVNDDFGLLDQYKTADINVTCFAPSLHRDGYDLGIMSYSPFLEQGTFVDLPGLKRRRIYSFFSTIWLLGLIPGIAMPLLTWLFHECTDVVFDQDSCSDSMMQQPTFVDGLIILGVAIALLVLTGVILSRDRVYEPRTVILPEELRAAIKSKHQADNMAAMAIRKRKEHHKLSAIAGGKAAEFAAKKTLEVVLPGAVAEFITSAGSREIEHVTDPRVAEAAALLAQSKADIVQMVCAGRAVCDLPRSLAAPDAVLRSLNLGADELTALTVGATKATRVRKGSGRPAPRRARPKAQGPARNESAPSAEPGGSPAERSASQD